MSAAFITVLKAISSLDNVTVLAVALTQEIIDMNFMGCVIHVKVRGELNSLEMGVRVPGLKKTLMGEKRGQLENTLLRLNVLIPLGRLGIAGEDVIYEIPLWIPGENSEAALANNIELALVALYFHGTVSDDVLAKCFQNVGFSNLIEVPEADDRQVEASLESMFSETLRRARPSNN